MWWWRSTAAKHLPLPLGPFAPGCTDVMSGFGKESTFVRLYYPSVFSKEQNDQQKWYRWSPCYEYLEGLAALVSRWANVIKMVFWFYGGEPKVPVMWEAEPLRKEGKKFPIVIFSHGYGATRFLSATIAYELASRGFFVTSIEHRLEYPQTRPPLLSVPSGVFQGGVALSVEILHHLKSSSSCNIASWTMDSSPSATYYYENAEDLENDKKSWIPHMRLEFGPNHYNIRNEQLKKRTRDAITVLDFLEKINRGEASNILKTCFDIGQFKDCLDLSSICIMGHSFGGATSLLAMAQDKRISCGIILDGWMFPVKEEELFIERPLLFINTYTFHIESNIKVMEKYTGGDNEIFTIRNTTHETHTDTPHILGYWLNWFMPKLDPVTGTNINNHLTLRFLAKHLGFPEDVSESVEYLKDHSGDFVQGPLLYSKNIPKRKL